MQKRKKGQILYAGLAELAGKIRKGSRFTWWGSNAERRGVLNQGVGLKLKKQKGHAHSGDHLGFRPLALYVGRNYRGFKQKLHAVRRKRTEKKQRNGPNGQKKLKAISPPVPEVRRMLRRVKGGFVNLVLKKRASIKNHQKRKGWQAILSGRKQRELEPSKVN